MSTEQWRAPVVIRVKAAVGAVVGVAVALAFFPRWLGVPAAVLLGTWFLGTAVLGGTVLVDQEAGLLLLRMGLITRRIRLTDVTAVLVDETKVSVARANGGEVSLYTWCRGPVDRLLRVPAVAGDVGHAISRAVALAQDALPQDERHEHAVSRTPARTRARLTATLLAGWGLVGIAAALLVRVQWHNPAVTVLGVLIALALGVSGLLSFLVGAWIWLTGRAPHGFQPL